MPTTTHDIRQSLLMKDPEFRSLFEEHSRCESRLEEILNSVILEEVQSLAPRALSTA